MAIFTPMTSRPNRASPTSFQFANSDEFLFAGGPASQPPKRTAWACVRTGSAAMEWVNARYQCSRRTWRRDRVDGRALSCHRCNSRLQSQAGSQRPRTWARSTATFGARSESLACKEIFVGLQTGWFSDRSARYLRAGRLVILQDTGFSEYLPTGRGLFAVGTAEEAAEAIGILRLDDGRHSRWARGIAQEGLEAGVVLPCLLRNIGVAA